MWYHNLTIYLCVIALANAAQLPYYASKPPLRYYHYPTPQNQLIIPQVAQRYQQQYTSYAQLQQQQQYSQPQHYASQQQQQNHYAQQSQTQQYQQQYRAQAAQPTTLYYQQTQQQLRPSTAANVAQRFTAPALENAAFTTALTSQGYNYGGVDRSSSSTSGSVSKAASSVSAARALPSSTFPLSSPSSIFQSLAASNDIAPEGAIDPSDSSVNLQLPLPVNIAPIKVQPLPLDAGASFSELANGVTSYGTVYPQRKRR